MYIIKPSINILVVRSLILVNTEFISYKLYYISVKRETAKPN